nr:immunoglobulin light chain junction region [Macaca mulatta]
CLQGYSTPFPF